MLNVIMNILVSYLCPIYNDIIVQCKVSVTGQSELSSTLIEHWYTSVVSVLQTAASQFIQSVPATCYKSWWNEELDILKTKAINSHKLWCSSGQPRQGPVFDLKNKDKLIYKNRIKAVKNMEDLSISDSLHECLLQKSSNQF